MSPPWRVLIADDRPPMRQRLRKLLEADGQFQVCDETADAAGTVAAAVRELPQLCLIGLRMPGGGAAAAWEITSRQPRTRVVLLTAAEDEAEMFEALRSGASGYLLEDTGAEQLLAELRTVMSGDVVIPRGLVTRLVAEFRDRSPRRRMLIRSPDAPPLTSREWEVLELLREGATTSSIAKQLSLSPATVRSHIAAVMRKLQVPDRESAINTLHTRESDDVEASSMVRYASVKMPSLN